MYKEIRIFGEEKTQISYLKLVRNISGVVQLQEVDENGMHKGTGIILEIRDEGIYLTPGYEGSLPSSTGIVNIINL